ncbi:helix-turn-helix transcriptional regulator [Aneurinibacillus thermoaerophilus]|uniref:helix-turn-helix transcriptional regulator n=1 Tax=Aneurinibacillus thermoaerophilus TaxID=143495 RepID=UPI002E202AEE|nr:helix-turn-helix transcriptional regulator [Aneurinibacillus thermoaerophilus]MED0760925.1 helix-turn-helix transcriptional regulator [Aneurinibacillus thermoaerophilus]
MKELIPLKNLIEARQKAGLTQDELAEKAEISRGMLSNIERGYATPSLQAAYRISKVLKKPIDYLFFNDNAQKMSEKKTKSA